MSSVLIRSVQTKRYVNVENDRMIWGSKANAALFNASRSGIYLVKDKRKVCCELPQTNLPTVQPLKLGEGNAVTLTPTQHKQYVLRCGGLASVEYAASEAVLLGPEDSADKSFVQFERSSAPELQPVALSEAEHDRVMTMIAGWLDSAQVEERLMQMAKVYVDELIEESQLQRLRALVTSSAFDVHWNLRTLLFTVPDVDTTKLALQICLRRPTVDGTKFCSETLAERLQCTLQHIASQKPPLLYTRAGPLTDKLFVVHAEGEPCKKRMQLWAHAVRSYITSGDVVLPGDSPWCQDFVKVLAARTDGILRNRVVLVLPAASSLDSTALELQKHLQTDHPNADCRVVRANLADYCSQQRATSTAEQVFLVPSNPATFIGDGARMGSSLEARFALRSPGSFVAQPLDFARAAFA